MEWQVRTRFLQWPGVSPSSPSLWAQMASEWAVGVPDCSVVVVGWGWCGPPDPWVQA